MSPVSPVFRTVVTVSIALKTQLEWKHPFQRQTYLKLRSIVECLKKINIVFVISQKKRFK